MPVPRLCIALCLCSLLLSGCMHEANPDDYTTGTPKIEDLVGTYVPDQHTTELLKATGKYPKAESSITLKENGQIEMVNVPDWWLTSFTETKGRFDSGTGKWTLDKPKNYCLLVVSFNTQSGQFSSSVTTRGNVTAMLSLVGQKPPFMLEMSIAEPNADVAMKYQKVK